MNFLLLWFTLLVLAGCYQLENREEGQWKTITIGAYLFDFPPDFELVEWQGTDSYVGMINGEDMWFGFDYGYYSHTFEDAQKEFQHLNVSVDTIGHQFRRIVWGNDPQNEPTGIYLRELNSSRGSMALGLSLTPGIRMTAQQQATALRIFRTGRHKGDAK